MPVSDLNSKLKIFIIAGEVSGDVIGGGIINAFRKNAKRFRPAPLTPLCKGGGNSAVFETKGAILRGIGGENMKRAGLKSIFPIHDLAVMGIFDVLARARTLTRRINQTVDAIIEFNPDIVLTIDSPGFAERVIKKIKKKSCGKVPKFYHVVAPQVWAWREGRSKKYAQLFDRLYCFFDFERPYFERHGLETVTIGHPRAYELMNIEQITNNKKKHGKNIVLIPGSRMGEVKKNLPEMLDAADILYGLNPGVKFSIPVVETTEKFVRESVKKSRVDIEIIPSKDRYKIYGAADVAVATGGTVTAELAMLHVPTVVVYKSGILMKVLARLLIKTKWVSLVSILLKRTVYPEILGPDANAKNISQIANKLLNDKTVRNMMIKDLKAADKLWGGNCLSDEIIRYDIDSIFDRIVRRDGKE